MTVDRIRSAIHLFEPEPFLRTSVKGEYRSVTSNYKPYKRYDDEFKRNAVELLESSGRSITEVSGDITVDVICRLTCSLVDASSQ